MHVYVPLENSFIRKYTLLFPTSKIMYLVIIGEASKFCVIVLQSHYAKWKLLSP